MKPLLLAFALVAVAFSAVPLRNVLIGGTGKDYRTWYETGQIVLRGGELYRDDHGRQFNFIYPPTGAVLLAPLAALGRIPLIVALTFVITGSWLVSIWLSVRLAGSQSRWLYIVPSLICLPFVFTMYLLGQPNLMLLACLLGAFAYLRKPAIAGALIAFAAAIKAFPVLAAGWLAYRRQWRALAWTFAFLVFFLVLLPAPFRGFNRNLRDLHAWCSRMMLNYDEGSFAQRTERAYSFKNQSLVAVANRLLRPVDAFKGRSINVANLDFRVVNAIIVVLVLALGAWFVAVTPPATQRTPETDAIEWAMVLLLVLIFSPLSYQYFYVWLIYPLTVALHYRLHVFVGIAVALLALTVPLPGLWAAEAVGNQLLAALVLLAGFGTTLRQRHAVC